MLRSAFQYRAYNLGVYGVEPPMIKAWTSRPIIIDAVLSLFDLTTKTIESSARTRDREPSSQLPALAAVLFKSIRERLDWLLRQVLPQNYFMLPICLPVQWPGSGIDSQRDADELQQRFSLLRPEVLETLRIYTDI